MPKVLADVTVNTKQLATSGFTELTTTHFGINNIRTDQITRLHVIYHYSGLKGQSPQSI